MRWAAPIVESIYRKSLTYSYKMVVLHLVLRKQLNNRKGYSMVLQEPNTSQEVRLKRIQERNKILREETVRGMSFVCMHCGHMSLFGDLGFIQTHYKKDDDIKWQTCHDRVCHLVCMKCRRANAIIAHKDRGRILNLIQGTEKENIFRYIWEHFDETDPPRLVFSRPD